MKFSKAQLGTAQFGLNYGIANTEGKPSYEKAREIVSAAYDGGINTLDTAANYADSEEIIGRILTELDLHGKMKIISKVPPVSVQKLSIDEAETFINKSVETSLSRLKIDALDVCLFHSETDFEYFCFLENLKQRGLIKEYGVSLNGSKHCQDVLDNNIKFVQIPYNIMDRRFDDFFPKAVENNVKIFARSLYLQGLLLMPEKNIKDFLQPLIPVRRQLEQLADSVDLSMSELCGRFVLSNKSITSILTGVDNVSQLMENLDVIGNGQLSNDILEEIDRIVPLFPQNIIQPDHRWHER